MGAYLKRGSEGPRVAEWQKAMVTLYNSMTDQTGHEIMGLPRYGIDGDFGAETEAATKHYQKILGVAPDGIVGPKTVTAHENFLEKHGLKGSNTNLSYTAEDVTPSRTEPKPKTKLEPDDIGQLGKKKTAGNVLPLVLLAGGLAYILFKN